MTIHTAPQICHSERSVGIPSVKSTCAVNPTPEIATASVRTGFAMTLSWYTAITNTHQNQNIFVGNRPACSVYNYTVGSKPTSGMGRPIPYRYDFTSFLERRAEACLSRRPQKIPSFRAKRGNPQRRDYLRSKPNTGDCHSQCAHWLRNDIIVMHRNNEPPQNVKSLRREQACLFRL